MALNASPSLPTAENRRERTTGVKSLIRRAGHFYFIRLVLVTLTLGFVLVAVGQVGFTLPNLFLIGFGLIYPHLCRLLIGELEGQHKRGRINLLIDGFYAGAVMPAIGFAILPSLVMLVINLFNWIAIGGPWLSALGFLSLLIGLVISGTFSRYAYDLMLTDPVLDVLAYALLFGYLLLVSLVIYRYISALQHRSIELQAQKNSAEIAQRRAERALLAVLPTAPARELHTLGKVPTRQLDNAILLLVDFHGGALHTLAENFHTCEEIFQRHGLERIKTSNRRYLAIATEPSQALAALNAAGELMSYLHDHSTPGDGLILDRLRIYIHCGPVETGLVQSARFNYDAVGDAIDVLHSLPHRDWPASARIIVTAAARALLPADDALEPLSDGCYQRLSR